MGKERDASHYDHHYTHGSRWRRLRWTAWYKLWVLAAQWVEENEIKKVVDVGCGIGPFARLLPGGVRYIGYDFSEVAIKRARLEYHGKADVTFMVRDINKFDGSEFEGVGGAVFCEVLEHIENDMSILDKLPKGVRVFVTVPTFDMKSHVRFFKSAGDVWARYSGLIDFSVVRKVGKKHFAAWGRKK